MKKILLVSKEWSPEDRSGLGYSALNHENILKEINKDVVTVGLKKHKKDEFINIKNFFHFLFNFKKILKKVDDVLNKYKPDIILVESLQTIISEIFLLRAFKQNIKTIIISHGISIYPYKNSIKYFLRFIIWLPYIFFLKKIIKNINIFMSLNIYSSSNRNFDTKLAKRFSKTIITYNNFSRFENIKPENIKKSNSEKVILCIGYINHIKNQIDLVEVAKSLKNTDIKIKIIYNSYDKGYIEKLNKLINKNKLQNIILCFDKNIILVDEISKSWLLINTSITEVSPLSLIEGISLNKIFLSYKVGNLEWFYGNITNYNMDQMIFNINSLNNNKFFEKKLKEISTENYLINFTRGNCKNSFIKAIEKV